MIFEKVKAIIVEQLGVDEDKITVDTNLTKDLEADSLELFQIINDIEDEFDVKIEDIEGIETVGDAVKIIEEQKK